MLSNWGWPGAGGRCAVTPRAGRLVAPPRSSAGRTRNRPRPGHARPGGQRRGRTPQAGTSAAGPLPERDRARGVLTREPLALDQPAPQGSARSRGWRGAEPGRPRCRAAPPQPGPSPS
nr:translation initiation factor IF-2-like [Saimiri boliviensis boliviensis]